MGKPVIFSPTPPRAIGDERLSALDLRVLMAIAVHDRMSKNGIGCTAGHGRLAALVRYDIKSLSRSNRTLGECGYVGCRANPLNPRSRPYFVIYNEFDNTYLSVVKGLLQAWRHGVDFMMRIIPPGGTAAAAPK